MHYKKQLRNIVFILGMLGFIGHAAWAQSGTVYPSVNRGATVGGTTNRDARDSRAATNRDAHRGGRADLGYWNQSQQGTSGYSLRYEDKHFGFQIGSQSGPSKPCYYNCGGYGYYPPPPPGRYPYYYSPYPVGKPFYPEPKPAGKPRVIVVP